MAEPGGARTLAPTERSEAREPPVLELSGITKDFGSGGVVTRVLHGVDLRVSAGELVAIIGPSGSGKSTLLNLIGDLMPPTSVALTVAGRDVLRMSDGELTAFRGKKIGFVFQFHHLISGMTSAENLIMPLVIERGRAEGGMRERALASLTEVGLAHKLDARPGEMSGGEQQRVAVARALIHDPPLVLADEPTGNLDTENSENIFELMRRYNRERRTAIILVTHDPRIAQRCDRIVEVIEGRIHSDRLTEETGA